MPIRRRQFLGRGVLGAAALLGAAWLARVDYAQKVSLDVLDLIPAGEREPELMMARALASQAEARTMLFVLTAADGAPAPAGAARRFAAELAASPAFTQALVPGDDAMRDALGRELFEQRLTLLFPLWLREREVAYAATGEPPAGLTNWVARNAAARLDGFLGAPAALAYQDLVPADPLLLLPGVFDRLPDDLTLTRPASSSASPALVWAQIAASPLSEAGQAPVFAAIDRATAALRKEFPGLTADYTGVNRFAAASRARIEREVKWLNALSLAAVLAVAFALIRGVHRGLHLVPVVGFAMLGAWVTATVVFDRLHILVLVAGSLLAGVAIDYGFHLYMEPPAHAGEDYWAKVRRLAKPLLVSCGTTAAGFALLLFSELPVLRQLGVFVGAGLLSALAAAVIYFSTISEPFLAARTFRIGPAPSPGLRRRMRLLLGVVWIAALPGLARLEWRDDIRELEVPAAALKREDARIRAAFGERADRAVYLSYGGSVSEARDALERFNAWLASAGGGRARPASLGAVIPTEADLMHAMLFMREHPEFAPKLREAFEDAGFEAGAFEPFFEAYARQAAGAGPAGFDAAVAALQAHLRGPMEMLLHVGRPLSWFVTLASPAPAVPPPAETDTVSMNQLQSLNRVFGRYRQSALRLSLAGLGLVGAGVFLSYGLRDGLRIFAISCGVCLGVFGLLGWLGQPLNLFHLLGAFLGVCLTLDYAIFSATSSRRREPPPASVRLSGLTTSAAFGVLALSGIPVVHALGLTVTLMVLAALLVIELEHLATPGKTP